MTRQERISTKAAIVASAMIVATLPTVAFGEWHHGPFEIATHHLEQVNPKKFELHVRSPSKIFSMEFFPVPPTRTQFIATVLGGDDLVRVFYKAARAKATNAHSVAAVRIHCQDFDTGNTQMLFSATTSAGGEETVICPGGNDIIVPLHGVQGWLWSD